MCGLLFSQERNHFLCIASVIERHHGGEEKRLLYGFVRERERGRETGTWGGRERERDTEEEGRNNEMGREGVREEGGREEKRDGRRREREGTGGRERNGDGDQGRRVQNSDR